MLRLRDDLYANSHPAGNDVLLIVEVSDTTLGYDRGVKLGLYARANILEVWVVNLPDEVIEIYTQPKGSKYQASKQFRRGDSSTAQNAATLVDAIKQDRVDARKREEEERRKKGETPDEPGRQRYRNDAS